MSSRGAYKQPQLATLKKAVADLVEVCGGLEACETIIKDRTQRKKISTTQIARYYDRDQPETQMPVDIVRALEAFCGKNIVSGFIAMDTGAIVVPVLHEFSQQDCLSHLSCVLRENGTLSSETCKALADGKLTADERLRLRDEAMKTMSALAGLLGDLGSASQVSQAILDAVDSRSRIQARGVLAAFDKPRGAP